tara:strand:+ start:668 stop:1036 length:369 start_codon:yes stop_codon:yes gene_type:complete
MALQANKTLDNGLVASYWRIDEVKFKAPDSWNPESGFKPHLFVTLNGYKDATYRAAAAEATSYTFNLDVLPTGAVKGDGWGTILTAGTATSGDIRPAIYDIFKTNSHVYAQHDAFISGATSI